MSTYSYPDDVLHRTVEAVKRYGSITRACNEMGIPRRTLQHRVNSARARWPGCLPNATDSANWAHAAAPQYTAPVIPDTDEDLDVLIERLAQAQEREAQAKSAAEWMRFDVHGDEPFCLAFIGDPHVDQCDLRLLTRHIDLIKSTDRMWAVGLGDWVNGWVGRLQKNYAYQQATERDGYRIAQWVLQQDIWWLLLLGNHDGERWHGMGSPLRWMESAAPVPIQEWEARFSIACGARLWRVWAAHDFPGNSLWNPLHGPQRRAQLTGAIADVFICGDHHVYGCTHTQHEHTGKSYWIARARGYKPRDTYALEKGYGEQNIGHSIAAVFDPDSGRILCLSDLEEAASYLNFLRGI